MENTQQTQAFYSKAPNSGVTPAAPATGATPTPPRSNKPEKKLTMKTALAILGILVFLVVASVGVFISQQQQRISGPVAPNVPSSTPSAAEPDEGEAACYLEFNVAPPDGVAECVEKVAYTAVDGAGEMIPAGTELLRGDEFYYQVTVSASKLTAGNVTFTDTLPAEVEYVADDPNNTQGLTYSEADHTLSLSLGQMQPGEEEVISFKVRLLETATVGEFVNSADIDTQGTNETVSCSTYHNIAAEGLAVCDSKVAYTVNEDGSRGEALTPRSEISAGQRLIYLITVSANEQTAQEVVVVDELPDQVRFVEAVTGGLTHEDGIVRAEPGMFTDELTKTFEFVVEVVDTAAPGIVANHVAVLNGDDESATSTCSFKLQIPNNQCNDTCSTNNQCPQDHMCYNGQCRLEENPTDEQCLPEDNQCNDVCDPNGGSDECPQDHSCVAVDSEYRCRLTSNPGNTQCQPPASSTPTPTPSPTPTPTPAIGCNENCTTNADCSNPDHICYTTADGNKCRLADYVESTTCTEPVVATATPTPQPELPQELPQTGWTEMSNWLKAGLVTIGVGAALLLLL